jgi:dolichol-phosphate hexosyltransferase
MPDLRNAAGGGRLPEDVVGAGSPSVAVVIPALDEAATIASVVEGFLRELPGADVVVFDNGSSDGTAEEAGRAGARVILEPRRGKGNVVASAFSAVKSDIIVLVDGDGTYSPGDVHRLLESVAGGGCDMCVGSRFMGANGGVGYIRSFGNGLLRSLVNGLACSEFTDVLSGYRALGRRLYSGVELRSSGFGVEAELTLAAVYSGFMVSEARVGCVPRPFGSRSKLRPLRDGAAIVFCALGVAARRRPARLLRVLAAVCAPLFILAGVILYSAA